jgi:hypothetical protein
MNVQKVEQELLKGLQNPPQGRDHGLRYKLPDNQTLYIHPDGFRAYVLWPTDPFHLSEKCFPPIERLPFKVPELTEENLLTPTGMETKLGNGKTAALIFEHPDGGKTYLDKGFLTPFDKGAHLYQEHSRIEGRNWSIVAVAETNRITGELEIVGYIMPAKGPKES